MERDILRRMTAKEFLMWEAYSQMEPFGEWRADVRAAQLSTIAHNMMSSKEGQKKLSDFLIDWLSNYDAAVKRAAEAIEPPHKQTWQEKLAIAHMWANAAAYAFPPQE